MAGLGCRVLLALLAGMAVLEADALGQRKEVTPIDKVISLLEGMKKEVEDEGEAEAKSYDEFACFCKTTTKKKATSITKGKESIDELSADIAEKTTQQKKASNDLQDRKVKQNDLSAKLAETVARCAKEKAEYEAEEADLSKAISSLKKAIKAMTDSKPKAASLLQGSVRDDLKETLAMAEALNFVATPKRAVVASMIQGQTMIDPDDPEYDFHSNDIIKLMESLEKDFSSKKKELDDEYGKTSKACEDLKKSLNKDMDSNKDAMKELGKTIDKLASEIAKDRQSLVEDEADMKDDELYLKDLTERCESRANDWDQRSSMRNDEITAISKALEVLKGDVKGRADEVNDRAFLQHVTTPEEHKPESGSKPASTQSVKKPTSFLQLRGTAKSFLMRSETSQDVRKAHALALLTGEGQRLRSVVLTTLAARSAADPFKKIKGLIQKLIERLLAESQAEATKKGFCDTELGKSRKERDFRFEETQDLSSELDALEAKRDELTQEIKELTEQLEGLEKALKSTTEQRKKDKEENLATIKTATEGYEAVNNALLILKSFYKQAAKAALIQKASPVDEDTDGPGFSGSYTGQQSSSHAVLDLLETISSDFARTQKTTEDAEETAHREFVKFSQVTKSSISSKTTKKELDEQDLKTTKSSLKTKMEDLQSAQKLLDGALKELEELKPTCIDTGMSYAERVKKREEEMEALKKALCILDEDKVEAECK